MSTINQQRAALDALALRLTPANLKRAIAGIRPSEAEHFLQMLRDASATLSRVPEQPKTNEEFYKW
ncbi:hypothetical protein BjapCC829_21695 [Bradyrhizobium barranii]|uniref:Uncharacterized protein n=1 Tax=Bradyrhizobium barranii TaxID=2992140 RepID=A0ABY3QY90_9BRAD|nr:hypothetical protein [Bradyrhizobium japonicum]UFW91007.1 hypothetical protein BjapCC829_21695 [Bradyrhizobium japonicum]